jgi:hypothetical protein
MSIAEEAAHPCPDDDHFSVQRQHPNAALTHDSTPGVRPQSTANWVMIDVIRALITAHPSVADISAWQRDDLAQIPIRDLPRPLRRRSRVP